MGASLTRPRTRAVPSQVTSAVSQAEVPALTLQRLRLQDSQAGPLPSPRPAPPCAVSSLAPAPWAGSARPVRGRHPGQLRAVGGGWGSLQTPGRCGGAHRNPEQGCCGTYTSTEDQPPDGTRPLHRAGRHPPSLRPSGSRQTVPSSEAVSVGAADRVGQQGLDPKTDSQEALRLSPPSPSCFPSYMHIYMLP